MNRYECTKKVGIIGLIGNFFLLIIKFIIAILSHSRSMFADAINSAGDIFSSVMTFIGNKIASVPSDEDHNFGHGKAEYIYSLLISIFMLFIASKILIDSLVSIINHEELIFSKYLIIVCIITIFVKLVLYIYTKKLYKKHSNILIKASMKDHRNDIFLSIGTLISIILSNQGYYYFDGIFGSVISLYIMFSGLGIFLESYKVLMDISIETNEKENIVNFVKSQKNVQDVNDFYTIAVGYKYIAILTIDVDGNLSTFKTHNIADDIENKIVAKYPKISKAIIHVNPI